MGKRFVSISLRHFRTNWFTIQRPGLRSVPFVLANPDRGRLLITQANRLAMNLGVYPGTALADARAMIPSLQAFRDKPAFFSKLLDQLAEYCIRFTPIVATHPPDGLILDGSGCTHLWEGEKRYLDEIKKRFERLGYEVNLAIADTIGAAWAIARFGNFSISEPAQQINELLPLPPQALRLEIDVVERLNRLGLRTIDHFIRIPRAALRRRFGQPFIQRLDQAIGKEEETIEPIHPIEPYQERLPCLEPIVTATGIEIALQQLLETLSHRMQQEGKGLRIAIFKCYRVDGIVESIEIGTNRPSHNIKHLFKLFEDKISTIEPALGIELFILEAKNIEPVVTTASRLWENSKGLNDDEICELLDRITGKFGSTSIRRYLPDEHYWPERSVKLAGSIDQQPTTPWKIDRPRPLQLLSHPDAIQVTAPIPDYPPMLFRYRGKLHKVIKADGPERIEQEWWLGTGEHRDYYVLEDEEGSRFWIFRSGHYGAEIPQQWFLHGYFA
ncbi:MAG: DNA polymerase Y family protein [Chitinophagaceae bacterium]|nr:DNA polymerase Y family protein [Chitinophagaceae bacterium]